MLDYTAGELNTSYTSKLIMTATQRCPNQLCCGVLPPPPDYCIIFQVVGVLKEGIFSNCVLMRCVHLAELGRRSRWTPAICSTWKSSRPVRSMRTVLLTASPDLWSPVFSPFLAACDGQSESYHHTTPECHVSHMPSPIKNTIIPKYHIF